MALSKHTKRFQITLNASKNTDKLILDYLEKSYNANDKIKELLYLAVVSEYKSQSNTDSNSKKKLLTKTNSSTKQVIKEDTNSDDKLLTVSKNNSKRRTKKETNNEKQLLTNSKSEKQKDKVSNKEDDDIFLDLNSIDDGYSEVKNEDKVKMNELEELKKFM